jgi:hypothetical protein
VLTAAAAAAAAAVLKVALRVSATAHQAAEEVVEAEEVSGRRLELPLMAMRLAPC